jgi:hypothetical protein
MEKACNLDAGGTCEGDETQGAVAVGEARPVGAASLLVADLYQPTDAVIDFDAFEQL